MRSRVIPGSFVTMDRRVPVSRLKSVDLPTLGRPTITMDGSSFAIGVDQSVTALAAERTRLTRCELLRALERIARRMAGNAFEEFWPDIKGRVFHGRPSE